MTGSAMRVLLINTASKNKGFHMDLWPTSGFGSFGKILFLETSITKDF